MLNLYQGNRLETLADRLACLLAQPLSNPLASEVVVTQHQGMARWISQHVAQTNGIAANIDFPFPSAYVWRIFHQQLERVPEHAGFDRDSLVWRVFAALPLHLDQPGFEPLRRYLQDEPDALKAYQLARRISDAFDQYLIYRPEWIMAWENGKDQHWQAQLWRALLGDSNDAMHRARLFGEFCALCDAGRLNLALLPERLFVFGVSSLPPAYLEVLARLGKVMEVHLFVLNPSLAFWEDIVDEKTLVRLRQRWRSLGQEDQSDYYPVGNSLLASMGKQGRDFFALLQRFPYQEEDLFESAATDTLLGYLQDDMLELLERGTQDAASLDIAPDDRSLQIHGVHSPMREVQVLHDQLLELFERHPDLRAHDVLVMAPDIDSYAPYIASVFGTVPPQRHIPWAVTDRSARAEHPLLECFMQLLGLAKSRFVASEVLSILAVPAVARAQGLDETALERIHQWVSESGIRWGLDGSARAEQGLPDYSENTWAFGLERLLLGYAMPAGSDIYRERLPYAAMEGGEARWLGVLVDFIERLRQLGRRLARRYDALQWQGLINDVLTLFLAEDDEEQAALQLLRDAMQELVENTALVSLSMPLRLEVVQDFLKGHIARPGAAQRFLTGQVNFCAMLPMRSIPFRVVCLLGMNDTDYPRRRAPVGFDLMADQHQPGDRSRRDDDRYLFLEALLSARDCLYISYVARSIRDNSIKLPSVLVSELLDYIEQGYHCAQGSLRDRLVTIHHLQPFSHQYFDPASALFSYADEWLLGAGAKGQDATELTPFVDRALPPPESNHLIVTMDELFGFLRNPARAYLRRLDIRLTEGAETLEDSEPFALDTLQAYQLEQTLMAALVQGQDPQAGLQILRAEGVLPFGQFGGQIVAARLPEVSALAERVRPLLAQVQGPSNYSLDLAGVSLAGVLQGLTPGGLVMARCHDIGGVDVLRLWLHHLVVNSLELPASARVSRHFGKGATFRLDPVDDAPSVLADLLMLYQQGQSRPLPFFPKSAYAYVAALQKPKGTEESAMKAARKAWLSSDFYRGEDADIHLRQIYRNVDPLDHHFTELALRIFSPILAHRVMED